MIHKQVLPESFDFGMPSVELVGVGSKGLDKTAMVKRASAFDDVLEKIEKKANREYLHVITTGAYEKYGPNRNCFVAGTGVTTDHGVVPIENIQVGDRVLTASGRYETVVRTMVRLYKGPMVSLKVLGLGEPVSMTADHPVQLLSRADHMYHYYRLHKGRETRADYERALQASVAFKDADTLQKHDYVRIPERKPEDRQGISKNMLIGNDLFMQVSKVTKYEQTEEIPVYNLEVSNDHTFCVPFVVHNCDAWNGHSFDMDIPYPEDGKTASVKLDGGLSKYHDDTYMKDGAVYQEHQTKRAGVEPSGEIVCARYNPVMERGELIIAVDTNKWAPRLQKKAQGKDIYLSIGADVDKDICMICGRQAKTASQHCDHFTKHRMQVYDCGKVACVMNDAPHFYDISGVDVPADRIAFVLQKVASGATTKEASLEAILTMDTRKPIVITKSAAILSKLSKMEKELQGLIEGDKNDEVFEDAEDAKGDFLLRVENYPSDEIVDSCNRKGILLSPGMLFKILGKDCENEEDRAILCSCDDSSCGDCSCMMQELEDDEDKNDILLDGSFDQHLPADLNLDDILEQFIPEFGASNPAIQTKVIRITITGREPKKKSQKKEASFNKYAQEALRRTYARYLISFAEQNDDATCMNALRKIATYGK